MDVVQVEAVEGNNSGLKLGVWFGGKGLIRSISGAATFSLDARKENSRSSTRK
jgi:hypothetical protein